jgi:serine/threonine protein kinase
MMSAETLAGKDFLDLVERSGVAEPDELRRFLAELNRSPDQLPSGRELAEGLIRQGIITPFQAKQLLQGKWRGFRIGNKYVVLELIGSGGMGKVFLCRHERMKRLVALKILPREHAADPTMRARFEREARVVAALEHPNIVKAHDIDEQGDMLFLVMEYIDGVDLHALVKRFGPLSVPRVANYISQAAAGLQHAHDQGLVHRDIKPGNLLLDRNGVIKLLDMGLARFFNTTSEESVTQQHEKATILGTADYLSPEQGIDSSTVDIRSDIYSLGCTAYFLLTGSPPFPDGALHQKLISHQLRTPKPVQSIRPDVPDDFAAILNVMMAKNPADRFQQPRDVVSALAAYASVPIDPPSEAEIPLKPWSRRADAGRTGPITSVSALLNSPPSGATAVVPNVTGSSSRVPVLDNAKTERIGTLAGEPGSSRWSWRRGPIRWAISGTLVVIMLILGFMLYRKHAGSPDEFDVSKLYVVKNLSEVWKVPSGFNEVVLQKSAPERVPLTRLQREEPNCVLFVRGDTISSNLLRFGKSQNKHVYAVADLRSHALGAIESPRLPIIPWMVGSVQTRAEWPDTFITCDNEGRLRPLTPKTEMLSHRDFLEAKAMSNLLIDTDITLPAGEYDFNSLLVEMNEVSAASGGTTLKLLSGAMLCAGPNAERSRVFGRGPNPMTIHFNKRPGFLYVCSSDDMNKYSGGRAYIMQARLTGTGKNPLIISGLRGSVLQLANNDNDVPLLVINGAGFGPGGERFRVKFSDDRSLGKKDAAVILENATLWATVPDLVVPRQLRLAGDDESASKLMVTAGMLRWTGKIVGNSSLDLGGDGVIALTNPVQVQLLRVGKGVTLANASDQPEEMTINGRFSLKSGSGLKVRILAKGSKISHDCYSCDVIENFDNPKLDLFIQGKVPSDMKFCLIRNRSNTPIKTVFKGMPADQLVNLGNGYQGRISYTGKMEDNALIGGGDIILYDVRSVK